MLTWFGSAKNVVLVVLTVGITSGIYARSIGTNEHQADSNKGVLSDRLSRDQQKTWKSIQQIIYAEDEEGKPLHPTLKRLLEQLETSNHTVHVEFLGEASRCDCIAGAFWIERFDPRGKEHVASIKLYLKTIDQAALSPSVQNNGESIDLARLNKVARYAEVFGHEMAHATDILFDLQRARMMYEFIEGTDQVVHDSVLLKSGEGRAQLQRVIAEREAVLNDFEISAQTIETQIWRELINVYRRHKSEKD